MSWEDQQDYADGACEGQTSRLETYLSVTNVLCKSLTRKVVCYRDFGKFCRTGNIFESISAVSTFGEYYCDE